MLELVLAVVPFVVTLVWGNALVAWLGCTVVVLAFVVAVSLLAFLVRMLFVEL